MKFKHYLKENAGFDVLEVQDTRQFVEIGDSWKPVPGSGDMRPCDRCNKTHEIHFTVKEKSTGKTFCVGGGCAVQYGMIDQTFHKSILSAMKTRSKLILEYDKLRSQLEKMELVKKEVDLLKPPPRESVEKTFKLDTHSRGLASGKNIPIWKMGEFEVWEVGHEHRMEHNMISKERYDALVSQWRMKEAEKKGFKNLYIKIYPVRKEVEDLEYRIKKINKKIEMLMKRV